MEVRYERDEAGLTTITADVPADLIDEAYQASLRELRRHVNVPGFRKGRVPPKMVESIVGSEQVLEYATERLRERVLPEAMSQLPGLVPLGEAEDLELGEIERGQPTTLTLKIPCAEVELGDWQGVAVERMRALVREGEARHELEHWHEHQAEYVDADHDTIGGDDYVVFALRIIRDGVLVEEYDSDDPLRVQIGNNRLRPSIDDELLGLKVGDEKTFNVDYPEDFDNEELRGTTAEFSIAVLGIQQREGLDSFVKRMFDTPDIEEATQRIESVMRSQREDQGRLAAREEAVRKVVDASRVDIPKASLEADVMEEIEEFDEALEQRGVDLDELEDDVLEREYASIRERVTYDRQREVVLQAVAQAAGIDVDRDDLARELSMISSANNVEPRLMMRRLEEQGLLPEVVRNARLRKAAEAILAAAEVTEVDPPERDEHDHAHDHGHDHDHAHEPAAESAALSAADESPEQDAAETAEPEDEPCP